MNRLLPLLLLLLLTASTATAQSTDTIRVCTWNVLNYGPSVITSRSAAVQTVIRAVHPDIFIAQEIVDYSGFTDLRIQLQSAVAPRYFKGLFTEAPDTKNTIFYDSIRLAVVGYIVIPTTLRDINEWVFVVKSSGDTFHIFGCHFKAGDTDPDSIQRTEEAALIRNTTNSLPPTHQWIVAGDLNTYTSTEGAYEELTYVSKSQLGFFVDPIDSPGKWHSDSTFTYLHTQSTRVREFGGGVGGGLNDRFNFVLLSQGLMNDNYLPGSYTTFGNDGHHFNDSINALPNRAVPDSIAQALYVASDHLPVYLDLVFPRKVSGVNEEMEKPGSMDLTERRE